MIKNRGITFRLSIAVLSSSTLIFLMIFWYNYQYSKKTILRNIEQNANTLALASVNKIETEIRSVEKIPVNLAVVFENSIITEKELLQIFHAALLENKEIFGLAIAFEPYVKEPSEKNYGRYFFKGRDSISLVDFGKAGNYFYEDWYQIARELQRPVWSEPYYDDDAGNVLMCTYSVPVYRLMNGTKELCGVIAADISLAWLQNIVSSIKIKQTGYGFLISRNGTVITHPNKQWIMNETIFSIAEETGNSLLRSIGKEMIHQKTGFLEVKEMARVEDIWLLYMPLQSNGWSMGLVFPKKELMSDVYHLNNVVILFGIIGFVLLLTVSIVIARSITRPLRKLVRTTEEIGMGNFEFTLNEVDTQDEVGKLAKALILMRDSLKSYIKKLTEATAAKERIEGELQVAHQIQASMLPRIFPPFPNRNEVDLFATIKPAKEVGGDFYDFFFVDENHLCVCIGDVSGKGVPSSLFMAVTRTLIKTKTSRGLSPDVVLTRVNADLCVDNDSCMFVTLFCGILDIQTGQLEYANGGHNPPLLSRKGSDFEFMDVPKGMALGAMETAQFSLCTTTLNSGDKLFMYTDGVTEALNPEKELFSDARLKNVLNQIYNNDVHFIIEKVNAEVAGFASGEPQSDDITMQVLLFNGKNES